MTLSQTFEQALLFETDLFGLERTMRALQSLLQLFQAYPTLLALLLPLFTATASPATIAPVLGPLKENINVTRRTLRTFMFLTPYKRAFNLLTDTVTPKSLETYLDILCGSLMGTFAMLETATLPDLMDVPGLEVFGPKRTVSLNIEAQRFWFCGLVCSILANSIRLLKLFAYAPVPASGEGYGAGVAAEKRAVAGNAKVSEIVDETGNEKEGRAADELKAERERLRSVVADRKRHRAEVTGRARALGRKIVADSMDLVIPGSTIGVFSLTGGQIGAVMFFTSFLTGYDTWAKYGAQVAEA